jgi:hypothetical protein
MHELLEFVAKLQSLKLSYSIEVNTPNAVMVLVAVPGERWEIEFSNDGDVDCEVFVTRAGVESDKRDELLKRFAD